MKEGWNEGRKEGGEGVRRWREGRKKEGKERLRSVHLFP